MAFFFGVAMAVANVSYLVDYNELFLHVAKLRVLELACMDAPTTQPSSVDLSSNTAIRDIIYTALNSAKSEIDSYLRKVYDLSKAMGLVTTVDASNPSQLVKRLNADYGVFLLERKRMGVMERNDVEASFRRRFVALQKSDAEQILVEDPDRSDQVLPRDLRPDQEQGTPFDRVPGYWSLGTTRGVLPPD